MNQQHRQKPAPPRQTRARRTAIISASLLAFGALLTTGCAASPPSAVAAPPIPISTPAAVPPSNPASESPGSTAPSPGTGSVPTTAEPTSDRQFCQAISLNLSFLTRAATSPHDPTLARGVAKIRQLASIAPAEIEHDLTVIADFDQHVLDQLQAGQRPEIKETPELTAALSHEANWAAAHC